MTQTKSLQHKLVIVGKPRPMTNEEIFGMFYMNMWTIGFGVGMAMLSTMAKSNPFLNGSGK